MTKKKLRHFAVVVVFIFGMIFFGVAFLRYVPPFLFRTFIKSLIPPPPPPENLFSQYVLSPIPKSVTNIKADQPGKTFGYIYTFRFNISREDLSLLINSEPFVRIWNVKYKNGMLEMLGWDWDYIDPIELEIPKYGLSLPLYGDVWNMPREPVWFRPGQWDNPDAYAFYRAGDLINTQIFEQDDRVLDGRETIKILLYNNKEREAYFIVSGRENR